MHDVNVRASNFKPIGSFTFLEKSPSCKNEECHPHPKLSVYKTSPPLTPCSPLFIPSLWVVQVQSEIDKRIKRIRI